MSSDASLIAGLCEVITGATVAPGVLISPRPLQPFLEPHGGGIRPAENQDVRVFVVGVDRGLDPGYRLGTLHPLHNAGKCSR